MSDHDEPLRESAADADPVVQFDRWYAAAEACTAVRDPSAMALATANRAGQPSVRMVLLKHRDADGLVFYTNLDSRKGRDLAENPRAALLVHWDGLGRQVRIEGAVAAVSRAETIAYARSRPRGSQLSALASPQSRPVESRGELESLVAELRERWADDAELPVPERWGGFRLRAERYEFWQHRDDRLHDRLLYIRADGGWERVRLAP